MSGRIYLRLVRGITATFIVATLVFTGLLYGGTTAVTQQLRRISAGVDLTGVTLGLGGTGDGQAHTLPYNFGYAPTPEGLVEAAFTMLQVVGVLPNLGYKPPAHSVVPDGDTFKAVEYPAVVPFLDALFRGAGYSLADSVETGAENMLKALQDVPAGEKVTIVSISQGTMAAERVRAELARRLANGEQNVPNPEFKMIGNPYRPDGGLLTRFAFLSPLSAILGIPFERPGPADSPFKTTDYANQYDGFADFPKYANPLAIVNALAGIVIQHGFPGYFAGDPNDPNRVETTVGNTTYVTFPKTLPLLAPFRIPLSLIGAERFVDFLEPVLRVFVEMGYDRTADPSKTQQLQLFTPLSKVTEALSKLPAAIAQSLDILKTGKYTPTLPKPIVSPETSTTDKQSPAATDSTGTLTAGEKDETTTGLKIDASATPSAKPSTPALSEQTTESKAIGKQVSATTTDDATTGKRTSTESGENAAPSQPTDTHPVTPADKTAPSTPSDSDKSADGATDKTDKVPAAAPVRVSTTSPKTKTLTSPKPATAAPSTQADHGAVPAPKSEPASASGSTPGTAKTDTASPSEKTTTTSTVTGTKQSDKSTPSPTTAGTTSEKSGTSASTAGENKSSPNESKPSSVSGTHSGSAKESSASKESSSAKHTEKSAS